MFYLGEWQCQWPRNKDSSNNTLVLVLLRFSGGWSSLHCPVTLRSYIYCNYICMYNRHLKKKHGTEHFKWIFQQFAKGVILVQTHTGPQLIPIFLPISGAFFDGGILRTWREIWWFLSILKVQKYNDSHWYPLMFQVPGIFFCLVRVPKQTSPPLKDHWSFHQEPCIEDLCNIIAMASEKRVSSLGMVEKVLGVR